MQGNDDVAAFFRSSGYRCCGCVGPAGPMGPQGPAGETTTNENAMRYSVGAQTVASGCAVALTASQINSTGSIAPNGVGGLTLADGQYLISFSADAAAKGFVELGAVFALNSARLAFAASLLTRGGNPVERLSLNAILNLTATGTLTVVNNTRNSIVYDNAVLTVVKLA